MWLASEMAVFAQVCDTKSFTAAARALGVSKVAVSRAVASLERRLGTPLLNRTTRRVTLTAAGTLLRPHCQRVLAEVDAVRARIGSDPRAPSRLRVLVDAGYGRLLVTPLVPRFLEHHADCELHVAVAERLPEAPSADWDVLVCNGGVAHPSMTQTLLGNPMQLLCATPAYLARHGRPKGPAQLLDHQVLRTTTAGEPVATLRLVRAGEEQIAHLRPGLTVDDPALVHSSTAAGIGIGVLPEFLCRQGLSLGRLERVLPEWSVAPSLALHALYPSAPGGSATVAPFVEFLLANMVPVLGGTSA